MAGRPQHLAQDGRTAAVKGAHPEPPVGLPTELQTLIFAHMITQPLIHGTHAETVRAHGTVRLLCHGGLCLADNLIDTQLCLPSRPQGSYPAYTVGCRCGIRERSGAERGAEGFSSGKAATSNYQATVRTMCVHRER